jgi:ATP-binding cassette subfamily B protein
MRNKQRRPGAVRALLRYLRPHTGKLLLATLALSVSSLLFFLIGVGLSKLTDMLSQGQRDVQAAFNDLIVVSYLVLAAYAFGLFVRTYLMRWVGERIGTNLRKDVFAKLSRLGPRFYDQNPYGEIQSRISADTVALQSVIGSAVPNGLHNLVLLIACGGYAAWLSWELSLVVLASVPVIFAPSYLMGGAIARFSAGRQSAQAQSAAHAHEMLRNAKLVQAYRHESAAIEKYARLLERFFATSVRNVRIEAWVTTITSLLSFAALTVLIWYGGNLVGSERLSIGSLIAFLFYAHICITAAAQLVTVYMSVQNAAGAASRIIELRDHPVDDMPVDAPHPDAGDIVVENLHFRYPTREDKPVLNGLNLRVRHGESVAIVGSSGAGKSTVFDLLLGFYKPDQGRIRIAGRDLTHVDRQAWLGLVSFVPQNPELLSGSVMENLRLGCPDVTEEAAWTALDHAHIADFVRSLPQGLHTDLGQDAMRLSGGQRQRLAIARALVRQPAILLLDEPTSALDAASEANVRQALAGYHGLTMLVITHRLETAMHADRIVMMHHGRVLAEGTHAMLLATSPEYARLVHLELEADAGSDAVANATLPLIATRPAQPVASDAPAPARAPHRTLEAQ